MTKKEKLIVSAYTGILMTDWPDFHGYAEELLGREIFSHEFGQRAIFKELAEKAKDDFLALCAEDTAPIGDHHGSRGDGYGFFGRGKNEV